MSKHRRVQVSVLAVAASSLFAATEVKQNQRAIYYDVYGLTADAVRHSMDKNTPIRSASGVFRGEMKTWLDWDISWWQQNGSCRITRVSVMSKATTTLPRWQDEAKAPVALQQRWNGFMKALKQHEAGHAKIAQSWVDKLIPGLRKISPNPSCEALYAEARRLAAEYQSNNQREQDEYDKRTRHGEAEGVVLP
ncbi:DUF922 domain-containing protein [Chitinimonas sp. PSY-7]|uniref:DUF922 domain-containing protein n=1 Tax=Chitinimonas sp. PSY-7 TaxID=3459088 RepID=UPI0040402D1A